MGERSLACQLQTSLFGLLQTVKQFLKDRIVQDNSVPIIHIMEKLHLLWKVFDVNVHIFLDQEDTSIQIGKVIFLISSFRIIRWFNKDSGNIYFFVIALFVLPILIMATGLFWGIQHLSVPKSVEELRTPIAKKPYCHLFGGYGLY